MLAYICYIPNLFNGSIRDSIVFAFSVGIGFVVNINKKIKHINENNKRKSLDDYTYYIDLSLSIIDYYNRKLYNFFDELENEIIDF